MIELIVVLQTTAAIAAVVGIAIFASAVLALVTTTISRFLL